MMLNFAQRSIYDRVESLLTEDALTEALRFLVDIPSPTGEEGPLARAVVNRLAAHGIEADEQMLDSRQSNAVAVLHGATDGPSLMLYAPIDTVTSNNSREDLPWASAELHSEMRAQAVVEEGIVAGLGAQNPKGHAACILVAFELLNRARVPLTRPLWLGFGAGGMPTNAREGMREGSGHGAGCDHMMRSQAKPDCAVIAKSGWAVSWEEVGLAWYEVSVYGEHTYVGSRHLLPYSNAISNAAKIIIDLEQWFPHWAEQNRSGLVSPQGVVSFIESGWKRMPAFTPAVCRFRFDLRISPRTTLEEADRAVEGQLREFALRHDIKVAWRRIVGIPGTATEPESPVIGTCIAAWEELEGRAHQDVPGMSGATDANILRAHGVPTARIGLPKVQRADIDFQRGMNMVSIADMARLTRLLLLTAIAHCTD